MHKKSQVSMEYVIIVAFVVAITVPMIVIYMTHSNETNDDIKSNQAEQIIKKIVDSAESVYYLGEPSKTTMKAYFPRNIFDILIGNKELTFRMKNRNGISDITIMAAVDINGTLPTTSGIHYITIESKGDYVWIES